MVNKFSDECLEILELLKRKKNVILIGSPGTGKSKLLNEVASAFNESNIIEVPIGVPVHIPDATIPIPNEEPKVDTKLQNILPAQHRVNRKVFRTVFHQNSKHREFITGVMPLTNGTNGFKVVQGTLYKASEHAKKSDGASLVIIDEINRGPAVQVFGGSIVSIEPEKRLSEDNIATSKTQYFEIIDPDTGDMKEYCLPEHLYLLAAMNEADVSVEPMDVAFLRRWVPYRLKPDYDLVRDRYSLPIKKAETLPDKPSDVNCIYEVGVQAWEAINKRIRIGRGKEFEIGQGIFFNGEIQTKEEDALREMLDVWRQMYTHIQEVFFGDIKGIAAVINIEADDHPLKINETIFSGEYRFELVGIDSISEKNIYSLLKAISSEDSYDENSI